MIEREKSRKTAEKMREYPARFLSILWIISSVSLAALGPFGTFERFGFLERLLNWSFAIGMSILVGLVVNRAAQMLLGPGRRRFLYDLVAVPAMTILYSPALYLHIKLYPMTTIDLGLSFIAINVVVVSLILIGLRELLGMYVDLHLRVRAADAAEAVVGEAAVVEAGDQPGAEVPLMQRLPEHLRGEVLLVSADNHYIEVRTERGSTSLLLRMSDALRELEGLPGLQVHRSHWVADRAVAGLRREGHRLLIRLPCGGQVPVSRSQVAAVTQRWGHRGGPGPATLSA